MVTKQKSQSREMLRKGSQKFTHFAGLFSRGPRVQERALLGTSVKLILKSIFPLEVVATILSGLRAHFEHSDHIVKVGAEATD